MDTYQRLLKRTYARLTGQDVDRDTTPLSTGQVHDLLDANDAVTATYLRASPAPATSHRLDDPHDSWDTLDDTYDLNDPTLVTWTIGDDHAYEIRVGYHRNGAYRGQWVFRDLDEDAVWATLNDV